MMHKVLSIIPNLFATCPQFETQLRENGIELIQNLFAEWVDLPNYSQIIPEAEGVICGGNGRFDGAFLATASRLHVIAKTGKGLDNIDLAAARARGVDVCNTGSANAAGVAELAVLLAMTVLRQVFALNRSLRQGVWSPPAGREIGGKTVGLVGFGAIARLAAQKFAALGCRVLASDIVPIDEAEQRQYGVVPATFQDILAQCDIVSLHLPGLPENRHIINKKALAQMKPGAVLVNTSRGMLVDEAALYSALTSGQIAGAGLDTFDVEPVEEPRPLLALDNVFSTPHIGGSTAESTLADCRLITENLVAHFTGGIMPNLVN